MALRRLAGEHSELYISMIPGWYGADPLQIVWQGSLKISDCLGPAFAKFDCPWYTRVHATSSDAHNIYGICELIVASGLPGGKR